MSSTFLNLNGCPQTCKHAFGTWKKAIMLWIVIITVFASS